MKCRICGCEMPDNAPKCEICGVFAENDIPAMPAEEGPEDRKPMKKGAKAALIVGISLIAALVIAAVAWMCADGLHTVDEGTWLDGHFELADAGIQMDLTDKYERDAATEKSASTEGMICDAVVQTPDKNTMMYLYRVDLTEDSVFGIFISEDTYLKLMQDSFETSETFAVYNMLPQKEAETVTVGGKEFLCTSYEGSFTDDSGNSYPLWERILIRREGKMILFLDIASSSTYEDIDTILALLQPCEGKE